jgi:ABC-type methionine transport system permease subunit
MNQSAYAISFAPDLDEAVSETLVIVKGYLSNRRHLLRVDHSTQYVGQMLDGVRALPFALFVQMLHVINRTCGKEAVRRILQTIVRPFGLDVVPSGDRPTKDVRAEVIEAAGACGKTFDAVQRAIADDKITQEERAEIEADVRNAQAQLDDVLKVLR